jgi:hypothetical protein
MVAMQTQHVERLIEPIESKRIESLVFDEINCRPHAEQVKHRQQNGRDGEPDRERAG